MPGGAATLPTILTVDLRRIDKVPLGKEHIPVVLDLKVAAQNAVNQSTDTFCGALIFR